jgi:hypothetical protein
MIYDYNKVSEQFHRTDLTGDYQSINKKASVNNVHLNVGLRQMH